MIICAGKSEQIAFARGVGVGLVEAAMGVARLCEREAVDSLVFVGSAGAYSRALNIGDIVVSDTACNVELGFLAGHAYTPIENQISSGVFSAKAVEDSAFFGGGGDDSRISGGDAGGDAVISSISADSAVKFSKMDSVKHAKNPEKQGFTNIFEMVSYGTFPRVVVNSSNYITTNFALGERMAKAGICVENMEFFAVMSVAKFYCLPCFGVFCVTNYCDSNAHADFLKNRILVREKLESHIQQHAWLRTYGRNQKFPNQGNDFL